MTTRFRDIAAALFLISWAATMCYQATTTTSSAEVRALERIARAIEGKCGP